MRGEFVRADGLVIPNNITTYGVRSIFGWALRNEAYALHMGLANCAPSPLIRLQDLNEPTIGVGGYARQAIPRNSTGWPVFSELNGETYYETRAFVFAASGPGFDKPINRLVLTNTLDGVTGDQVVALSGPLPEELTIIPTTPEVERTFKYRIYGR